MWPRPWPAGVWRTAFNAGQYVLTVAASGAVLTGGRHLFGSEHHQLFAHPTELAVVFGAAGYSSLSTVLSPAPLSLSPPRSVYSFGIAQQLRLRGSGERDDAGRGPCGGDSRGTQRHVPPAVAQPLAVAQKAAAVSLEKEHLALHDGLARLPNRALFHDPAAKA